MLTVAGHESLHSRAGQGRCRGKFSFPNARTFFKNDPCPARLPGRSGTTPRCQNFPITWVNAGDWSAERLRSHRCRCPQRQCRFAITRRARWNADLRVDFTMKGFAIVPFEGISPMQIYNSSRYFRSLPFRGEGSPIVIRPMLRSRLR